MSQYNGSKESPPAPRRKKNPPGPCTFVDRPEPCSFLPLDLGYTLYFGNPLPFQQKPNFSSQESRPFFSFSLLSSCRRHMRGYEKSFIRRLLLLFTHVFLSLFSSLLYMFRKAEIALTLLHTHTHTHAQGGILCDLTDLPVPT